MLASGNRLLDHDAGRLADRCELSAVTVPAKRGARGAAAVDVALGAVLHTVLTSWGESSGQSAGPSDSSQIPFPQLQSEGQFAKSSLGLQ